MLGLWIVAGRGMNKYRGNRGRHPAPPDPRRCSKLTIDVIPRVL